MMQQYQAAPAAWPTSLQPASNSSHAVYPRCPTGSYGQLFLGFLEVLTPAMTMFIVCPISTRAITEEQEVQLLAASFQPGSEHRRCYDMAVAEERLVQDSSPVVLVAAASAVAVALPAVPADAAGPVHPQSILDLPLPAGPMMDMVARMVPARLRTALWPLPLS